MKRNLLLFLLLLSLSFHAQTVFAWSDTETHPILTKESIDFYNIFAEKEISEEEKEWIIQGATDEDTAPRWINHFWDPIHNEGWTGEHGPDNILYEMFQKYPEILLPGEGIDTPSWATSQKEQNRYGLYKGNHAWQKAIYDYVTGKEQEAFYSLGFVLHLLQDMAVPEHTKNDTHIGDSPLENYCKTNCNIDADNLGNQGLKPYDLENIRDYFYNLALYTNTHFFSKDTINIEKYRLPRIVREEDRLAYGTDKNNEFPLAIVETKTIKENNQYKNVKVYSIKEAETHTPILQSYWQHLSREAVLSCSGLIQLFFEEVEKARQNPELLEEPPENPTTFATLGLKTTDDNFITTKIFKKTVSWVSQKISSLKDSAINLFSTNPNTKNQASVINSFSEDTEDTETKPIEDETSTQTDQTTQPVDTPQQTLNEQIDPAQPEQSTVTETTEEIVQETTQQISPAQNQQKTNTQAQNLFEIPKNSIPQGYAPSVSTAPQNSTLTPPTPTDTTAPNSPIITSPSNNSTSTNATITFTGTAEATSTISQSLSIATTTANSSGDWSIQLTLNQETNNIQFTATDSANNTSASTEISVFVDSTAPQTPTLSVAECANSITTNTCLIATTTLNISWTSSATDFSFYTINQNGVFSTTTATSTQITTTNNSTYTFGVSATDELGNTSATSTQEIEINNMPIVINEVAWAGTSASTYEDEWIELYNPTSGTIDLSNFILYSETDLEPYIELSGQIAAGEYYLIERTNDDTVASTTADLITPFGNGLNNVGEVLVLSHASTTIDQTASCIGATTWCPGFDYKYKTMERINPTVVGTDTTNWSYNNELVTNGKTANGDNIKGTPKARNSQNYLIAKGDTTINSDITLTKENSPYIINTNSQSFQQNSILTIEPGVTVISYGGGLSFLDNASIKAQGTEQEPIILTSSTSSPGSWFGVEIKSTNNNSIFEYTQIKYAGKDFAGTHKANLNIENTPVVITNSTFENSDFCGLKLKNSASNITNNTFQNNSDAGILSENDTSTLSSNTFINNKVGLNLSNSQSTISSNAFTSNTNQAIISFGVLSDFTNNTGSNNGTNAIAINGDLTTTNSSKNLVANPLPYYLNGYATPTVAASSTLTIETGTIIKGDTKQLNVNGNLVINGNQPGDITFTSIYDDETVGDTNGDATSTTPTAGQFAGINIASTGSLNAKGFTMKYSGSIFSNTAAGINLNGALANISEAIFDNSYPYGIRAQNCEDITIENAKFQNHNFNGPFPTQAAITTENSTTTLTDVIFENNALGILSDALSTFSVSLINWLGNTATTSPEGIF